MRHTTRVIRHHRIAPTAIDSVELSRRTVLAPTAYDELGSYIEYVEACIDKEILPRGFDNWVSATTNGIIRKGDSTNG
jgi:hypothetical protein